MLRLSRSHEGCWDRSIIQGHHRSSKVQGGIWEIELGGSLTLAKRVVVWSLELGVQQNLKDTFGICVKSLLCAPSCRTMGAIYNSAHGMRTSGSNNTHTHTPTGTHYSRDKRS